MNADGSISDDDWNEIYSTIHGAWARYQSKGISKMEKLLKLIDKAFEYIKSLAEEKLKELREPLAWRKHEELRYVFAMNELF